MSLFIDILGWVGTAFYLAAYALNSGKKLESDSYLYQGMNILAGVVMVVYTLEKGAYSATALNFIWAGIGVFTLLKKRKNA